MLHIEFDREYDGRWLAEIPVLPGVMAYGAEKAEARARVEALALRVLADRLEYGESVPELGKFSSQHDGMAVEAGASRPARVG